MKVWTEAAPGLMSSSALLGDPIPTYLVLGGVSSSSCPGCSKNTSEIGASEMHILENNTLASSALLAVPWVLIPLITFSDPDYLIRAPNVYLLSDEAAIGRDQPYKLRYIFIAATCVMRI